MKVSIDRTIIEKELSNLDNFVHQFIGLLESLKIEYTIVSGYVSILLGRSRGTEDVDILIPKLSFLEFEKIFKNNNRFSCIIDDLKLSYETIKEANIRFFKNNNYIPNIKLKFAKNITDEYTLKNKYKIIVKENIFYVSPPNLQIPYKLYLGSEKDIEDARFLYNIFKDILDLNEFNMFIEKFKVKDKLKFIK